jgi:hypothetical protein
VHNGYSNQPKQHTMASNDLYLTTLTEVLLMVAEEDYGTLIEIIERLRATSEGTEILYNIMERDFRGAGEVISDICRYIEEGDCYEDEDSTDVLSCIETT